MRVILLFSSLILFFSCSPKHEVPCDVIVYNHTNLKESYKLSSFIDTFESIRLELPEPYFFGRVGTVLFNESDIYVSDRKQDVLYRFDKNGVFLNTIGKCGNGPGEFASMSSFFLGEKSIFINDIKSRRIHEYAFNGDYLNTISFSFNLIYNYIRELPNGNFLCHTVEGTNLHGVWIMDKQGKLKKRILDITEQYPFCSSGWNTISLREDGNIEIYDPPVGTFYLFNPQDESIKKIFQHKSSFKMTGDFKGVQSSYYIKEEYANCDIVVNTNNYLFSLWSLPEMNASFTLFDKKTKKIESCSYPELDIPRLYSLGNWVPSNLPNILVSVVTDEIIEEYFSDKRKELDMNEGVLIVNKLKFKL